MASGGRVVRDDGDFVLRLGGRRQDASRARAFLETLLPRLGWGAALDDACLLVSELVANVALHARSGCWVRVSAEGDGLRVSVEDNSPVLPRLQGFSDDSTTGRGLRLVERLADTWGAAPTATGKEVWFAFDRAGLAARAAGAMTSAELRPTGGSGPEIDLDLDSLVAELGGWEDEDAAGPVALLSPSVLLLPVGAP